MVQRYWIVILLILLFPWLLGTSLFPPFNQYHIKGDVRSAIDSSGLPGKITFLEGKINEQFERATNDNIEGNTGQDQQLTGTKGEFDLRITSYTPYTALRVVIVNNTDTLRSLPFPIEMSNKTEITESSTRSTGSCFSSTETIQSHVGDRYTLFISTIFVP